MDHSKIKFTYFGQIMKFILVINFTCPIGHEIHLSRWLFHLSWTVEQCLMSILVLEVIALGGSIGGASAKYRRSHFKELDGSVKKKVGCFTWIHLYPSLFHLVRCMASLTLTTIQYNTIYPQMKYCRKPQLFPYLRNVFTLNLYF